MRLFIALITMLFLNCSNTNDMAGETDSAMEHDANPFDDETSTNTNFKTYKILSLGDSYTIGESVCETCRFPEQLKQQLISNSNPSDAFELTVIARTGWTTTNLINAIESRTLYKNFDLVTLLIGVNNQYQNKPFSVYEREFPQLVNMAITQAKGAKSNIIVLSIPDYAYTPFGNGNETISNDIDTYNDFAKNYCETNGISFVNITDITRLGLVNPDLVASDGLHPSNLAYSFFVERLLPLAIKKLTD
ncbi:SGNH/GDSL hydrolase family protein [Yeosuana sp. AK3]